MRLLMLVLFWMVAGTDSVAQDHKIKVIVGAGHAFFGTGDLSGYTFFNEVELRIKNRFTLNPGIQLTNHSGSYDFTDHEYRYVTTGITLYTNFNYFLVSKPRHRISIGAGPSLRYQSSSAPSLIGVTRDTSGTSILNIQY